VIHDILEGASGVPRLCPKPNDNIVVEGESRTHTTTL
jgi:hypothetical protein